jgi:hypothetical protein
MQFCCQPTPFEAFVDDFCTRCLQFPALSRIAAAAAAAATRHHALVLHTPPLMLVGAMTCESGGFSAQMPPLVAM